jgi:hypothetical protein
MIHASSPDTESAEATLTADPLLGRYRLPDTSIFLVGVFDKGITVLSQQIRALNLVWALVESGEVLLDRAPVLDPLCTDTSRKRIAVIGAGFAGLTVAAGLLKKRVNADITVFERCDTALPLQHGSDSRWLHPHIYDWPGEGSEAYSAALPVLNWTASRASDVVVQVLKQWEAIADADEPPPLATTSDPPTIRVFCNTRHIQVCDVSARFAKIEWIGEERSKRDPAVPADGRPTPVGDSQLFDIVILAVGFGLEQGARTLYWRNETLAQPHLGQARSTFIVSGSGDGAMVDLFRLRISHFRQDRILAELFSEHSELLERLRGVHDSSPDGTAFEELEQVWTDYRLRDSTAQVLCRLRNRLRQDTTVLLRVREPSFERLFVNKRVSFQNRLLAFLLYRCGAFTPVTTSDADLPLLALEHGVTEERIIIRHGTYKRAGLTDLLTTGLHSKVIQCFDHPAPYLQPDIPVWSGGYFDMPGLSEQANSNRATDNVKEHWRKEYLPSPMEAMAITFCAAVAGFVSSALNTSTRLRVTLHRMLICGDETVLQQCCDYQGVHVTPGDRAGRTFPTRNGTIGAAFTSRRVVRTGPGTTREELSTDMTMLSLDEASQKMSHHVASVAAIPLLGPATDGTDTVLGILYLDSFDSEAFVNDQMMGQVIRMCEYFLKSLPAVTHTKAERIANTEFWRRHDVGDNPSHLVEPASWRALQPTALLPPRTGQLRHLNFDFTDFTPVEPQ